MTTDEKSTGEATVARTVRELARVNDRKAYAHLEKILVIYDDSELLTYYNIGLKFVTDLSVLLFVFADRQVHLLNRSNGHGHRSGVPYGLPADIGGERVHVGPDLPDLAAYDLILCCGSCVRELVSVIGTRYFSGAAAGGFQTAAYSFCHFFPGDLSLEPAGLLFKAPGRFALPESLKAQIPALKRRIEGAYVVPNRPERERAQRDTVEKIARTNARLRHRAAQKVLVLDDSGVLLFIGDVCKWIQSVKRQLIAPLGEADITINWQHKKKYEGAEPIARHAFGRHVTFTNQPWEALDLSAYDLVLCHEYAAGKLLLHLAAGKTPHYPAIYYYLPETWSGSGEDPHGWHFKTLRADLAAKAGPRGTGRSLELVLQAEEQAWGAARLAELGVESHQQVVILPDSSSEPVKDLPPEEYAQVLAWLAGLAHTKVLLFDPTGSGKKERLAARLAPHLMERVVVVEGGSLRGSMCLLGAPQVKAVIGPCTGLLHLANGIYTHYLQAGLTEARDLPLLLTYVGAQYPGYSPWHWWANTRAACLVHRLDAQGEPVLRPLAECPRETSSFERGLLPAGRITARLLIDALRQHYLHQLLPRHGLIGTATPGA